ncbi:MAG: hypothetical protein ABEH38_09610 [Flavobacteriales bacterium]
MWALRTFFLAFFLSFHLLGSSQDEKDVLRYSRSELHGTARYIGMAGAFGSLGADVSSLSSNPAGIALFRKNELSFTPSFNSIRSKSHFLDQEKGKGQFELAVEQTGLVLTRLTTDDKWKSSHLGITYERIRSFNDRVMIKGKQLERSILDYFVRLSNGIHLDQLDQEAPFTGELAYQTYLMDPKGDSSSYSHRLGGAEIDMEKRMERKGSMGEVRVTLGADRSNRLYLGASLGIPLIDLQRKTQHKESVRSGSNVTDFTYEEQLSVKGYGANIELGAIYRPLEALRFGLSARTPSILHLADDWKTRMKADHNPTTTYEKGWIKGHHEYRILTPFRLMGSMAYFIKKHGVIAVEYRFKDQGSGKLIPTRKNSYGYGRENQLLRKRFKASHEVRLGAEWRLAPLYIRGGVRFISTPTTTYWDKQEGMARTLSFGVGYRKSDFLIDLSFRTSYQEELHRPLDPRHAPTARIGHRMLGMILTGGLRL